MRVPGSWPIPIPSLSIRRPWTKLKVSLTPFRDLLGRRNLTPPQRSASSMEFPPSDPMIVCLNGQFIPESEAKISVFDRCFLYGDGLFESIPFYSGKPFRWAQHFERFERGAGFLDIHLPFSSPEIA